MFLLYSDQTNMAYVCPNFVWFSIRAFSTSWTFSYLGSCTTYLVDPNPWTTFRLKLRVTSLPKTCLVIPEVLAVPGYPHHVCSLLCSGTVGLCPCQWGCCSGLAPCGLSSWITFPCRVTLACAAPQRTVPTENLVWKMEVKLAIIILENAT